VEIQKVSIIGQGALGVLFAQMLRQSMDKENLKFIADMSRIERYRLEGVFSNGERCDFAYVSPDIAGETDDLIMFAVKATGLCGAIEAIRNRVGENTVILSMLNGISSEQLIADHYGWDKVILCVAQGMDAVKIGNRLSYSNMGLLCIGDRENGMVSEKVRRVERFFKAHGFPHEVDEDMKKRMWGKWMVNVGVNQTLAVRGGSYRDIQNEGETRDAMLSAMREVIALGRKADVGLDEKDLPYWLNILGKLDPDGKPSMLQDVEAKRKSEVELFSGTVIKMGREHGVPTPVNELLYRKIIEMENMY